MKEHASASYQNWIIANSEVLFQVHYPLSSFPYISIKLQRSFI